MQLDCAAAFSLGEDFGLAGVLRVRPLEPKAIPADELARGAVAPEQPVPFKVSEGSVLADLVGTTMVTPYVVSPSFVRCLSDNGFTGWSSFPVRISGRLGEEMAGYRGLSVTGRSGPIDDGLSERVMADPPIPGGRAMPHLKGMCPEADSWDGSDLFLPEGTVALCVTSRVREALLAAGIVGARFERLYEVL